MGASTEVAVLGYPTIMDIVNEYTSGDSRGMYLEAAKTLARKCPLVKTLPMKAGNQIMSNIGSRDSYLGSPGTRRFNEGVLPTSTHSTPYTEPMAMFADYSEVDLDLWRIQNDPNAWRQAQDRRKMEGFTQKLENQFWYGSQASDPASFNGIMTRFNSTVVYPNGDSTWYYNVYDGGGTTALCSSVVAIEFGLDKVCGLYPPNIPSGGLRIEDRGQVTREDYQSAGVNKLHEVLRTYLQWFVGLDIADERCVQRYANINALDSSGKPATTNIIDEEILITMLNRLPGMGEDPGTFIFMNRTLKTQADILAIRKMNTFFTQDGNGDAWGRPVTRFRGVQILVSEKMSDTETAAATS